MAGNIFKCELEAWKVWIRKKRIGYCITSGRLLWSCHPIVMPSNHKKGLFDVFWLDCPKSPLKLMLKLSLRNCYIMMTRFLPHLGLIELVLIRHRLNSKNILLWCLWWRHTSKRVHWVWTTNRWWCHWLKIILRMLVRLELTRVVLNTSRAGDK